MVMTDAQHLMNEGRKEGRAEGRAEASREMLALLLETKFGALREEVVNRVTALNESQLRELSKRVLTAQSLEELGL